MHGARITGPGAGVYKYDILTALAMWGLHGGPSEQVTVLRLVALVTARYNWSRDEVSIGQRDLARLWGVTERTVKREIRRLVERGLVVILRPGVKGRVASYRLVPEAIAALTAPLWDAVGPDFAGRFQERHAAGPAEEPRVLRVDFQRRREAGPAVAPEGGWGQVQARLRQTAPEAYGAWFAGLRLTGDDGQAVTVAAPSAFVARYVETHHGALLAAAVAEAMGPRRVVLGA